MYCMLPSVNGLRAFEAAARLGSFTLAAAELNVTQTAISHQIRRLEEQLGIRLFIRAHRTLALTPEASDYLPSIRSAFEDLRRATARLRRTEARLTVSTTASLATKWLVSRVAAFQDAHPGSRCGSPRRTRWWISSGTMSTSRSAMAEGSGRARGLCG